MPKSSKFAQWAAVALLSLLVATGCSSHAKPAGEEPTMSSAMARLQASDFAGAARILEQVTAREPKNGRAWRNLAMAYQNLKQWDREIDANQRALEVDPAM